MPDDADPPPPSERPTAATEGPPQPEVEADLLAHIQRLADDLVGRPDGADLAARLDYLVGLLILRGHLKPGHRRLLNKVRGDRSTALLAMYPDKHRIEGSDIDCASRIHLCKARCCSYSVTLSPQDVLEGKLRWELYEPYRLLKDDTTGYCRYLRADAGCSVYHDRPATCRVYDCRFDSRVWLDFDNMIPAPMDVGSSPEVIPLGEWPPPKRHGGT